MNTLFTKGYALLIGVGKCKDSDLSLPTTVKDTQAIYNILIERNLCAYQEDKIKILNNQEATKNNILQELQWLKEKAQSDRNATILIYYSGHGWLNKDNDQYYLIPNDTNPTKITKSALSADEFTQAIREINSERLLVIIDSCHAAGMATSKDAEKEFWEKYEDYQPQSPSKSITSVLSKGKGRVVFTSSQGEEKSWIMKDNSLSIYTFHFLEALQGAGNKAGDTVVKVSNLMNYLGETVPKTANDSYSASQIPRFDFDTDDFPISMLRGGKGLPEKGWDEIKPEVNQTIYKIADNLTQTAEQIININQMTGGQIGDVITYNDKVINQSHSGSGDNVAGDKNVTNNYGINQEKENTNNYDKGLIFPPQEEETSNTISNIEVPVYFATDRQKKETNNKAIKISYGGKRNSDNQLEFGLAKVSIPPDHRMGYVERPNLWKLEFREDINKHIVIVDIENFDREYFQNKLRQDLQNSKPEILLFIHGYNNSFEDALLRTAQISHDLQFEGATILYSWPSAAKLESYLTDENNIEWTMPHLQEFLQLLLTTVGAESVNAIAHSMGNRALARVIKETDFSATNLRRDKKK